MSAHATLAPSAAHRWLGCPASVQAEQGFADEPSFYAAEGSVAHEVAADHLAGDGIPVPDDLLARVNETVKHDGFDITITPEMVEHVQAYVDYVLALPCEYYWVENRVDMNKWVPDCWGTADFFGVTADGTLHVVDLKYGRGERVDPISNPQFRLYALGAYDLLSYLDIKRAVMHVFQPRIDNIASETLTVTELLWWGESLAPTVKLINSDNPPYHPGAVQCRWCKAKATCGALAQQIEDEIKNGFPILDGEPAGKSEVDLAHALTMVDLAKSWASAVEAYATQRLELGHAVPGFKLVAGRSLRKWKDEAQAEETLRHAARRLKIKVSDLYSKKFLSLPQVEKLVGKKAFTDFSDLVVKPAGKPVIAPESDKRPAIDPAQALDFPDLTEPKNEVQTNVN